VQQSKIIAIWSQGRILVPTEKKAAQLTLSIDAGPGSDDDELDRLTRQLRNELAEVPEVESVDFLSGGAAPPGARAVDPLTLGTLLLAIVPTALPKLMEVLNGWAMRGENRKVKIKTQVGDRSVEVEYNPTTMSQAELKQLVQTLSSAISAKE
jgi:hypothetical protein